MINKSHLTRHLDCPSAPLGEVEPVLDLVLGEDVSLDLVLGDLIGVVLEEGFLDGVVSPAGAELKLGYCRKSDMAAGWCFVNMHSALLLFVWNNFNLFLRKG